MSCTPLTEQGQKGKQEEPLAGGDSGVVHVVNTPEAHLENEMLTKKATQPQPMDV